MAILHLFACVLMCSASATHNTRLGPPAAAAAEPCTLDKTTSSSFGDGGTGQFFDENGRDPKLNITEMQLWFEKDCLMGIKTVLSGVCTSHSCGVCEALSALH